MKEHFALSKAQLDYLKGHKTLKNQYKEKIRIRRKAIQAWSIFVPILKSKVVDWEWKISLFQSPTPDEAKKLWAIQRKLFGFEEFLSALFQTAPLSLNSDEIYKMKLARIMINKSLAYYSNKYAVNPLITQEVNRFKNVLELLEESIRTQTYKAEAIQMYEMRSKQSRPPHIYRDEYYHALCKQCHRFSGGTAKNEQQAIAILTHDKYCTYNKEFEDYKNNPQYLEVLNDDYLQIIKPKRKS